MHSVIAYMSLSKKLRNSIATYKKMIRNCKNLDEPTDLFAEEAEPDSSTRILWDDVIQRIESGMVKTLIVPNMFHIAGKNAQQLRTVMSLCRKNNVELRCTDDTAGAL